MNLFKENKKYSVNVYIYFKKTTNMHMQINNFDYI